MAALRSDAVVFAAVDVETTGFSPRLGDRLVEVAFVRFTPDGRVHDEFATLVNPERDVGPTHIHGIRPSDVVGAPRFADVLGEVAARIAGAVLVAHNARFDLSFLRAEFQRAGAELPPWPSVCTLRLTYELVDLPTRRLDDCCRAFGIPHSGAHAALEDARAVSRLFVRLLELARARGIRDLESLGCRPTTFPPVPWPPARPSGNLRPRGAGPVELPGRRYVERLLERLSPIDTRDADIAAYLDLLDRVLEDRRITEAESELLFATAQEWGLERDDAERAHWRYFEALCETALLDGHLSSLEEADLEVVAHLLGLGSHAVEAGLEVAAARLERAGRERSLGAAAASAPGAAQPERGGPTAATPSDPSSLPEPRPSTHLSEGRPPGPAGGLAGKTVCFTGALLGRIDGAPITRKQAHRLAEAAGLIVRDRVTRDLDILVVADPYTQSGKARIAARYGTRVMAEAAFWQAIGVEVD